MKHPITLAALTLALLAGATAFAYAQDDHGHGGDRGGQGPAPHGGPPPGAQHGLAQGIVPAPAPRGPQAGRPGGGNVQAQHGPQGPQGGGGFQAGRPGGGNGGAVQGQHDLSRGGSWRAPQRYQFRGGGYAYPNGYGYRAWSFGMFLPGPYFTPDYVIVDFWDYGLQPPPSGYQWIRVGPDALLVRDDGYILDVVHRLFY